MDNQKMICIICTKQYSSEYNIYSGITLWCEKCNNLCIPYEVYNNIIDDSELYYVIHNKIVKYSSEYYTRGIRSLEPKVIKFFYDIKEIVYNDEDMDDILESKVDKIIQDTDIKTEEIANNADKIIYTVYNEEYAIRAKIDAIIAIEKIRREAHNKINELMATAKK
jgi:hypothetical protein